MCAKECDNWPKLSKCKWGLWGDQGEGNRGFCDIVGTPKGLLLGKGESLTCDLPAGPQSPLCAQAVLSRLLWLPGSRQGNQGGQSA